MHRAEGRSRSRTRSPFREVQLPDGAANHDDTSSDNGRASDPVAQAAASQEDPAADLRELGYEYRGGRLLQVGKEAGFQFQDQQHYDRLADAVLRYVGTLLVSEARLTPITLPLDAKQGEPCTQIFASAGYESASKILLMIQGSGRVRVGVWGCALCINASLDQGTMLPYLKTAAEQGYGVLVLNPNENRVQGAPVPGSETCTAHVAYVWEHIVSGRCNAAATVDIIAHSNGGRALLDFLGRAGPGREKIPGAAKLAPVAADATARIRRVVFTDSYHDEFQVSGLTGEARKLLGNPERVVNYVPSNAPLGTPVERWTSLGYYMSASEKACKCLSAAVSDHAATNQASLESAFAFLAAEAS